MRALLRFPDTADSLPNPVWCSDFVHDLTEKKGVP